MVFNSLMVLSVAQTSAEAWQQLSPCIGFQDPEERISSQQLLDLLCCFPLQQLGRFALCLWTFLCLPPPDSFYSYSYHSSSTDDDDGDRRRYIYPIPSSSSSSSSSVDLDDYYYNPHSD